MYLLDTNTLIYFFKGLGKVPERLLAVPPGEIAVPSVTVFEIETGIAKSRRSERLRQDLDDLLTMVTVLPFGMLEARSAAKIRAGLESAGIPIGPYGHSHCSHSSGQCSGSGDQKCSRVQQD